MPVTTSAKQALRKDRRRTVVNLRRKRAAKQAADAQKRTPSPKNLQKAYSLVDKLAKHHLIHPNKAARLKSKLARLSPASS